MNNIIEFKKDCIMKTFVSEITDISISHDYKILDDTIEGYFDVLGEYKVTKSSITKEDFSYTIPFTIALSSLIDKDTIDLTINDFSYEVEKDILHIKVSLSMNYEELVPSIEETPIIEDNEKEEDKMEEITDEELNLETPSEFHNELMLDEKKETESTINKVLDIMPDSGFKKYKVYIMREEDTLESVMIKYNIKINDLKEYNDVENIKVGDKIVIPCIIDDKDK